MAVGTLSGRTVAVDPPPVARMVLDVFTLWHVPCLPLPVGRAHGADARRNYQAQGHGHGLPGRLLYQPDQHAGTKVWLAD